MVWDSRVRYWDYQHYFKDKPNITSASINEQLDELLDNSIKIGTEQTLKYVTF